MRVLVPGRNLEIEDKVVKYMTKKKDREGNKRTDEWEKKERI